MRPTISHDRRQVLDVSKLPTYAFGVRSMLSFGNAGFMLIEGTLFALSIAAYLHLRARSTEWPLSAPPPDLFWGTFNLVLLLISGIPNQLSKRAADRLDLRGVRIWMFVCTLFGIAFLVIRVLEFRSLNVWWDQNAYGSLVWALLGFHTIHLLTEEADSAVLLGVMVKGPLEEKRFVDVAESAAYWYFVVAAWLPIYAVLYLVPRIW